LDYSAQLRALILDDQAGIAALIEEILSLNGWQCTVLTDAMKLEGALAAEFDLIVCDFKMPERSGLEVLRFVRRHRPLLARRFLLMTGNPAELAQYSNEFEGVPILMKPFTLSQLLQATEKLLEQQ
jgi:CheY-like chemotaxis protein